MHWWLLAAAIVFEALATTALKASDGFVRVWPSLLCVVGYSASFYLLAHALRVIPVGVAYAIWSGVGLVLVCVAAYVFFGERLNSSELLGIALIVAGVTVLNFFSSRPHH